MAARYKSGVKVPVVTHNLNSFNDKSISAIKNTNNVEIIKNNNLNSEVVKNNSEVVRNNNSEVVKNNSEVVKNNSEVVRNNNSEKVNNSEVVRNNNSEKVNNSEVVRNNNSEVIRNNNSEVVKNNEHIRNTNEITYSIVFDPPIGNLNKELNLKAEIVDDTESIHCYQTPNFQTQKSQTQNSNFQSQNFNLQYQNSNLEYQKNPTEILIHLNNMFSNIGKSTVFNGMFFDLNKNKYPESQFQVILNYGDDTGDILANITQIPNTSQYIIKSNHLYTKTGYYNCTCTVVDKDVNFPITSFSQYTILPRNN